MPTCGLKTEHRGRQRFVALLAAALLGPAVRPVPLGPARGATTFAASVAAPPRASELLTALGRELWLTADDLLDASVALTDVVDGGREAKERPLALSQGATALRNAANGILDEDLDTAWGELEVAACACELYLPGFACQGLVDLFSYEEPCCQAGWRDASRSLQLLCGSLAASARRAKAAKLDMAAEQLTSASERLRRTAGLFEPGGFYMPPDPRAYDFGAWDWDVAREPKEDDALLAGLAPGSYAAGLAAKVREELDGVDTEEARRSVLRKLVRVTHPDQNPGHEKEVVPILRYVQRLRARGDGEEEPARRGAEPTGGDRPSWMR